MRGRGGAEHGQHAEHRGAVRRDRNGDDPVDVRARDEPAQRRHASARRPRGRSATPAPWQRRCGTEGRCRRGPRARKPRRSRLRGCVREALEPELLLDVDDAAAREIGRDHARDVTKRGAIVERREQNRRRVRRGAEQSQGPLGGGARCRSSMNRRSLVRASHSACSRAAKTCRSCSARAKRPARCLATDAANATLASSTASVGATAKTPRIVPSSAATGSATHCCCRHASYSSSSSSASSWKSSSIASATVATWMGSRPGAARPHERLLLRGGARRDGAGRKDARDNLDELREDVARRVRAAEQLANLDHRGDLGWR